MCLEFNVILLHLPEFAFFSPLAEGLARVAAAEALEEESEMMAAAGVGLVAEGLEELAASEAFELNVQLTPAS